MREDTRNALDEAFQAKLARETASNEATRQKNQKQLLQGQRFQELRRTTIKPVLEDFQRYLAGQHIHCRYDEVGGPDEPMMKCLFYIFYNVADTTTLSSVPNIQFSFDRNTDIVSVTRTTLKSAPDERLGSTTLERTTKDVVEMQVQSLITALLA